MHTKTRTALAAASAAFLFVVSHSTRAAAQTAAPATAQSSSASAQPCSAARSKLPNWWQQNANTADPAFRDCTLFHTEGSFGGQHYAGNNSGHVISTRAQFVWRKKLFSNYWTYSHAKQDVSYGIHGAVAVQQYTFAPIARIDVTKKLYVAGGLQMARNDNYFVHRRTVGFGGIGVTPAASAKHRFFILGAAGRHSTKFKAPGQSLTAEGSAFYAETTWAWTLDERTSLTTTADYLLYEQGGGRKKGKSLDLNPTFSVAIRSHVQLNLSYSINKEENVISALKGTTKTNRIAQVALQFSY